LGIRQPFQPPQFGGAIFAFNHAWNHRSAPLGFWSAPASANPRSVPWFHCSSGSILGLSRARLRRCQFGNRPSGLGPVCWARGAVASGDVLSLARGPTQIGR
jgi:hypothetical protein